MVQGSNLRLYITEIFKPTTCRICLLPEADSSNYVEDHRVVLGLIHVTLDQHRAQLELRGPAHMWIFFNKHLCSCGPRVRRANQLHASICAIFTWVT